MLYVGCLYVGLGGKRGPDLLHKTFIDLSLTEYQVEGPRQERGAGNVS